MVQDCAACLVALSLGVLGVGGQLVNQANKNDGRVTIEITQERLFN